MIRLSAKSMKLWSTALFAIASLTPPAFGSDSAPLSEPNGRLIHPIVDSQEAFLYQTSAQPASRSDIWEVLKFQTAVKAQGQRNTCTVFSTTALLESLIWKQNPGLKKVDLSEQWLQYLATLKTASGGAKGSTVAINFAGLREHGVADEKLMPYSGSQWSEKSVPSECQGLSGKLLTQCVYAHVDPRLLSQPDRVLLDKSHPLYSPDFVEARKSAYAIRDQITRSLRGGVVSTVGQTKDLLRRGTPVILEVDVFYGTWNHSRGTSLGIDVKEGLFASGVATFPEPGSVDAKLSPTSPARHSVVIVGYDDDVELTYTKKMVDGKTQTFKRKGVYYFKNSWGKNYGRQFKLDGKRIPGFGVMTQDYAHRHGQIFSIQLSNGQIL